MSELKCREYQSSALVDIRNFFMQGYRKVLLWLGTGAGKTFIFCLMIKEAVKRGRWCIVVVRGRKLVDQASARLFREGVPHGVLMSNHWNYRPHERVQVCSIDTLISRNLRPKADLIIIDEAHLSNSKGYKDFLADYPDAYMVAVTATPWVPNGLRHCADEVVHPITVEQLMDEGYLVPFRYFAPSKPNLDGVSISASTQDYVTDQLAEAMIKGQLTGSIIDHWIEIASKRKTLLFAVNVKHSKLLTQRFNDAGISAEHCDASVNDKNRSEIIKRLESGETKVVCNVGIFCTGVDVPPLGAIVMARPTKSKNLYIQMSGRGTRTFPGKTDCILLDHAGNIDEHGFPTDEEEVDLDGRRKRETGVKTSKICKNCFCVFRETICPECGVVPPPMPTVELEENDGKLKEITQKDFTPIKKAHKKLLKDGKKAGKKTGWAHYQLVNRFGYENCKEYLPEWFVKRYEGGRSNPFGNSPYRSGV